MLLKVFFFVEVFLFIFGWGWLIQGSLYIYTNGTQVAFFFGGYVTSCNFVCVILNIISQEKHGACSLGWYIFL